MQAHCSNLSAIYNQSAAATPSRAICCNAFVSSAFSAAVMDGGVKSGGEGGTGVAGGVGVTSEAMLATDRILSGL